MRLFCALSILVGVSIIQVVVAQDPFGDVPVEPRPSEYMHWNAEAFTGFQAGLEDQLRDGAGIWGTPFVVASALPRADHRPHDVQIIHRAGAIPNRRSTPPSGTSTSS